jgi:hypothetical protein
MPTSTKKTAMTDEKDREQANRHARRAAARARHTHFYTLYVRHMPEIPVDAPLEPGKIYHSVIQHDAWCRFYQTENFADCNCTKRA